METAVPTIKAAALVMTLDSITAFIEYEKDRGTPNHSTRNFEQATRSLYNWLPEEKVVTKELLLAWRQQLKDAGHASQTVLDHIICINRYLDYMGFSDIRFNRGRPINIAGKQFGYLTAIEATGAKLYKSNVWRCRCKCGKEVECSATQLLTGNNLSCGCLRKEQIKTIGKLNSIRKSLKEQVFSTQAKSGYTGVTAVGDKWKAYITYQGQLISLGFYDKLKDAVKARAKGKELVQKDAQELLAAYEKSRKNDSERHKRKQKQTMSDSEIRQPYKNNACGHIGIHKSLDKWVAQIAYRKVTYYLGIFNSMEEALSVRQQAEKKLQSDPNGFPEWVVLQRQTRKQKKKPPI